jgi:putative nucleotidyltransferase with HDIG domain
VKSGREARSASWATAAAAIGTIACVVGAALTAHESHFGQLFWVLAASALASNLSDANLDGHSTIWTSGAFLAGMLAVPFAGPAAAVSVAFIAEIGTWLVQRYRRSAMLANLATAGLPTLAAGIIFHAAAPNSRTDLAFYALLAGLTLAVLVVNTYAITGLIAMLDGASIRSRLPSFRSLSRAFAISIILTVAAADIYVQVGIGGIVFAIAGIVAFNYMAQLVDRSRKRAREYAALSWGVLSGLVRTLDIRDPRASRHSAAVASYARDVAHAAGMSDHDAELAHTAGLLHDIGRFALSDRVMERGRPLTNEDWTAIRRHPELGADMLRDLGLYGPVAEIVHCHHERVDGRGYPRRLKAEDIPEIAKILAVAEVYDTLTADDTYRTPISSFEALNELRRVAGSQLDERYVETLAEILAGRGVEYRHAREASFERELDLERRIGEAASP